MASKQTSNLGLNQWEPSDRVIREEFNRDNQKLDAAIAGKASAQALNDLTGTVNSMNSTLRKKGNCQIVTGTYQGDDTCSKSLNFPGKPLVVFVSGTTVNDGQFTAVRSARYVSMLHQSGALFHVDLNWSPTGLVWSGDYPSHILNEQGCTYHYAALLAD